MESAAVCKRYGGPVTVICCGVIIPTEGLHTQVWEVEAATGGSLSRLYFLFLYLFLQLYGYFESETDEFICKHYFLVGNGKGSASRLVASA